MGGFGLYPICHSRASDLPGARGIPESGTLRAAATREGDSNDRGSQLRDDKAAHY